MEAVLVNAAPLVARLAPNVISIDEARAWRDFQVAVKAVQLLAEPKPDNEKPADAEPRE